MGKSAITVAAFIALCGVATVSAGLIDWFGDNAGEELAIRERRALSDPCSPKIFMELKSCCDVPEIIPEDAFGKCMKKGKKSQSQKSKRNHKKAPEPTDESTSGRQARAVKSPAECEINCVLKGQNFLDASGNLNMAAVSAKFNTASPAWQAAFNKAAASCQAKVGNSAASDNADPPPECKKAPGMTMKCIFKELYQTCPTPSATASDPSCVKGQAELAKCDPFAAAPKKKKHSARLNPENTDVEVKKEDEKKEEKTGDLPEKTPPSEGDIVPKKEKKRGSKKRKQEPKDD